MDSIFPRIDAVFVTSDIHLITGRFNVESWFLKATRDNSSLYSLSASFDPKLSVSHPN